MLRGGRPLVVAFAAVAVLASTAGCSGKSESYEQGYASGGGREWAMQMLTTASADVVSQRMYASLIQRPEKADVITDQADYLQGCQDAMRDATK